MAKQDEPPKWTNVRMQTKVLKQLKEHCAGLDYKVSTFLERLVQKEIGK